MIVKVTGIVLVMAASLLAGFYVSNLDACRMADLYEMKKALTILKSEVEFAATPLPQALYNIGARVKKPFRDIFLCIGAGLEDRRGSLPDLWEMGFRKYQDKTFLKPEDVDCLISLGTTLGYLDGKMQIAGIDLILKYIEAKTEQLHAMSVKNKKLYRSLGLLGGILIVIVLI